MQEEYRIINEFPNYSVSNLGNVKNNITGKVLKPQLIRGGYIDMGLIKDKKTISL